MWDACGSHHSIQQGVHHSSRSSVGQGTRQEVLGVSSGPNEAQAYKARVLQLSRKNNKVLFIITKDANSGVTCTVCWPKNIPQFISVLLGSIQMFTFS